MKYYIILIVAFLQYTLSNGSTVGKSSNISSLQWKSASKIQCKNFKCPPVEDPLCVRIRAKTQGSKTKDFHIVLFNKCELEYIKCHQGYHATVLPMKNCGRHDKLTGNLGKARPKRSLRLDKASARKDNNNEANENKYTKTTTTGLYFMMTVWYGDEENDTNYKQNEEDEDADYTQNEEDEDADYKQNEEDEDADYKQNEEDEDVDYKQNEEDEDADYKQNEEDEDADYKQTEEDDDADYKQNEEYEDADYKQSEVAEMMISKIEKDTNDNQSELKKDTNENVSEVKKDDISTRSGEEKQKKNNSLTDMENDEMYKHNVQKETMGHLVDYDLQGSNEGVDFEEYNKDCPTVCPAREVMICARCKDGVYRTFMSICHLRMFNCAHGQEKAELVSRYPCILSAPYLTEAPTPKGRVSEPDDVDRVLQFIRCREKLELKRGDPRCANTLQGKQELNN